MYISCVGNVILTHFFLSLFGLDEVSLSGMSKYVPSVEFLMESVVKLSGVAYENLIKYY